jgi:tetratricopeptide (TPR) repeat protein
MDKKQENIKKRFMQALALYKQGKINAAQIICDEILHDHPNEGHTLQLLGLIAITNRQFSEAVFHLKKSLTTLENNAICHHNLASAYNLTGEKEKAVKHYLRAIEIKPEYVEAYFNLIYIFDLKSNKNIIDPIKKLIHQTDLSNNDISLLHFAAGKYYHTIKNYSEAFQHIEQANHRQPSTFQPLKHHQIVDNIIQTFNKKLFEQCKSAGNDSDMPLFVIGMPTSGSNLLGKMLTSHPDIGTIGNNTDFYILAKELDQLRPMYHPISTEEHYFLRYRLSQSFKITARLSICHQQLFVEFYLSRFN